MEVCYRIQFKEKSGSGPGLTPTSQVWKHFYGNRVYQADQALRKKKNLEDLYPHCQFRVMHIIKEEIGVPEPAPPRLMATNLPLVMINGAYGERRGTMTINEKGEVECFGFNVGDCDFAGKYFSKRGDWLREVFKTNRDFPGTRIVYLVNGIAIATYITKDANKYKTIC